MSGWLVVEQPDNTIHVVPAGDDDLPLPSHEPSIACPCRPKLIRGGPLDPPIVSHREPRHSGSAYPLDA